MKKTVRAASCCAREDADETEALAAPEGDEARALGRSSAASSSTGSA